LFFLLNKIVEAGLALLKTQLVLLDDAFGEAPSAECGLHHVEPHKEGKKKPIWGYQVAESDAEGYKKACQQADGSFCVSHIVIR
jgi:hypothetical protein